MLFIMYKLNYRKIILKQIFIILLLFALVSCGQKQSQKVRTRAIVHAVHNDVKGFESCIDPQAILFLGINVDSLCVKEKEFSRKDNLFRIFKSNKLDKFQYEQFLADSKDYFDFSTLPPKQKYFTITKETDSTSILNYLVFKISTHEYIIANCTDTTLVQVDNKLKSNKKHKKIKPIYYSPIQIAYYEKQIDTTEIQFSAIIQKSVAKTFKENKIDYKLIDRLNKSFNNNFNLYALRKGDTLQFIYDQLSINGQFLDYGHVQAVCVKQKKKKFYAIDYFIEDDSSYQYVDDKGKYLKTAFIKSPLLKGGNIVSRFNLHRFHPVLLVEKAHLGTDFAAPQGAPIIATASGIVEDAQFSQNNGNYVKIRHDRTYETQYLHMSRFAKSIRKGVRVQQGQVIGYVGSTGLSTGPHVCYRFWKNGTQVDPLKEKLNVMKQIPKSALENYYSYFNSIQQALDRIIVVI